MKDNRNRCAVWGTGFVGQKVAKMASTMGYDILTYCRSPRLPEKTCIGEIPICTPEKLKQLFYDSKIDHIIIGIKNQDYLQEVQEMINGDFPKDISVISVDDIENKYLDEVQTHLSYRWNVDFQSQLMVWIQNFMSEVDFWVRDVACPTGQYHWSYLECLDNKEFGGIFDTSNEILSILKEKSIVMDIGCGLLSKYGTKLPNSQEIQLLAVDPLAPFYNQINQNYAGKRFRKSQFGLFEFIANFYPKNYCDLVLINNALDHCIDPYKSIIECLHILKVGGRMRLSHRRAEAVYEAYQGLHKWNIDVGSQGELIFWNLENAVNVSDSLKEICDIQIEYLGDKQSRKDQWITAYVTKTKDFQLEQLIDLKAERYNLAFFIGQLMLKIADYTSEYLK